MSLAMRLYFHVLLLLSVSTFCISAGLGITRQRDYSAVATGVLVIGVGMLLGISLILDALNGFTQLVSLIQ